MSPSRKDRTPAQKATLPPCEGWRTYGAATPIRAIALSAGTTVLGMLPLVISDVFWRALGVLIMFGLACGALLTPLVIPLLYSLLFRVPVSTVQSDGSDVRPERED